MVYLVFHTGDFTLFLSCGGTGVELMLGTGVSSGSGSPLKKLVSLGRGVPLGVIRTYDELLKYNIVMHNIVYV